MGQQYRRPTADDFDFPPDAKPEEIDAFLKKQQPIKTETASAPKAPTWSDQMGLNEPTDSTLTGFVRGAGGAVVDMAQGATARVRNAIAKSGDPVTREIFGAVPVEQQQDVMSAPETFAGKVGGVLPDAAAMAIPGPAVLKGAKAAVNAIPTTAKAGAKFQSVMAAAKNIPIDVKEVGDAALRIQELAERGGSMPLAVRKILNRMTDPEKAGLVYEESRDFASNISRLSADEMQRLTPVVRREVAHLSAMLNKANAMAAKQAGKADEYASAMKEYASAMRLRSMADAAIKGAKKTVPYASAAGAGTWLANKLMP